MTRYDEVEVDPMLIAKALKRQATGSSNPRAGWSRDHWIDDADEALTNPARGVRGLELGHVVNLLAEVHDLRRRLAELGVPR